MNKYLKILKFIFFPLLLLTLANCSSKYSQSNIDELFTPERAVSKTSGLSVQIPKGWHQVDANDSTFIDLWLVEDNFNASISLLPIHTNMKIETTNLYDYFEYSKVLNKVKYDNNIEISSEDKPYVINDALAAVYNFTTTQNQYYRVIVFQLNNNFYELTALLDERLSQNNISKDELARIQDYLLASIKIDQNIS
ncbi:MAG: hypothetical protein KAQ90_09125 [Melioribacteraceae bacterium]|nr:hypothetical protein [Melioribacteraceae bacterium]